MPENQDSSTPSTFPSLTPFVVAATSVIGFYIFKGLFSKQAPVTQDAILNAQKYIKSDKVFVASKSYCPYCRQTKALLEKIGVKNWKVIELDTMSNGSEIQNALYEISGQQTVPNIFINGKHIGGNSDLQLLERQGKLRELLKEADAF